MLHLLRNLLFVCQLQNHAYFVIVFKSIVMECSFRFVNSSPCAGSTNSSVPQIIPLSQCKHDCANHLVKLGVSESRGRGATNCSINEEILILNRSGLINISGEERLLLTICSKHRVYLTWQWPGIKRKSCSYQTTFLYFVLLTL